MSYFTSLDTHQLVVAHQLRQQVLPLQALVAAEQPTPPDPIARLAALLVDKVQGKALPSATKTYPSHEAMRAVSAVLDDAVSQALDFVVRARSDRQPLLAMADFLGHPAPPSLEPAQLPPVEPLPLGSGLWADLSSARSKKLGSGLWVDPGSSRSNTTRSTNSSAMSSARSSTSTSSAEAPTGSGALQADEQAGAAARARSHAARSTPRAVLRERGALRPPGRGVKPKLPPPPPPSYHSDVWDDTSRFGKPLSQPPTPHRESVEFTLPFGRTNVWEEVSRFGRPLGSLAERFQEPSGPAHDPDRPVRLGMQRAAVFSTDKGGDGGFTLSECVSLVEGRSLTWRQLRSSKRGLRLDGDGAETTIRLADTSDGATAITFEMPFSELTTDGKRPPDGGARIRADFQARAARLWHDDMVRRGYRPVTREQRVAPADGFGAGWGRTAHEELCA